jgi:hypothetical protein
MAFLFGLGWKGFWEDIIVGYCCGVMGVTFAWIKEHFWRELE